MKVGELIRSRRIALGLQQKDLAEMCGVSTSAICRWETGNIGNMRRDRIALLAKALGIDPMDLVTGTESESVHTEDDDRLEALHQDPRLCLLFDRVRKMSDEDIDWVNGFVARMMKERDGE